MSETKYRRKMGTSRFDVADSQTVGMESRLWKGLQSDFNKAYKDWEKRRATKPNKNKIK